MAKNEGQKLKILYILSYLKDTDEQHPISTPVIIQKLDSVGISCERKSIYDDMQKLTDFGYDIMKVSTRNGGGYYLGSRDFELAELKMLVDAVTSSRFVSVKKSRELIHKLETLASAHEALELQRQVYVVGRVKTENESAYYSIDSIHRGIQENKVISFQYLEWNEKCVLVPRREGKRYKVSPWALIYKDDFYYLIGYDNESGTIKHYRADKISKVEIEKEHREGETTFRNIDLAQYTESAFGMFGGETKYVTVRFHKNLLGVVIDRFGKQISLRPLKDDYYSARLNVMVSGPFYGWLSGLGKDITIVSPEDVKKGYQEWLQSILTQYQV